MRISFSDSTQFNQMLFPLLMVVLQLGNVGANSADFFMMVYTLSSEELAKNLTSSLHSSESLFDYKLYRSSSVEGIGYQEARDLCLQLGSFPAIILSEDQHAKVFLNLKCRFIC